jgi:hypothetical protein
MKLLALKINGSNVSAPGGIPDGGRADVFPILSVFVTLLIILGVVLSLIYLALGAISWITSEGDKQKLAQAKSRITFSIIGLVVVFLSFFIINYLHYFFRVN